MLRRPDSAIIDEIVAANSRLPHSFGGLPWSWHGVPSQERAAALT